MASDTIAAISTALGEGAIAIVRVSGPESIAIVNRVYRGKKSLLGANSHTIHYGHIYDPGSGNDVDEALVSLMRSPNTFTREDVVEVNCHGGIVAVQRVLGLILDAGARLAQPGEFTKRAFLNGRIDLSQAEAVMDLIHAKSEKAMNMALRQVKGKLSEKIRTLRQTMLELLAHIEVSIDYPEHDVEEMTYQWLSTETEKVRAEIGTLLRSAEQGKILREGLSCVIVGRPNVGKSSLLNLLARENRAIVTDVPGTTRDVIEEMVQLQGIPLRLIDTAGIRETEDVVERIGVERSRRALDEADLVLLVLNYNEPLSDTDRQLIDFVDKARTIVLINKTDLPQEVALAEIEARFGGNLVFTSMRTEEGIEQLEQKIANLFFGGELETEDLTYLGNARHTSLLKQALGGVDDALNGLALHVPIDMIGIDLRHVWQLLGDVIGENVGEQLLDQIFSQFCLGK